MEKIIPIVALVLIFGPKLLREIKDYLLKKEQIKADSELRAEALRMKNSIELEKFIQNENYKSAENRSASLNNNFDEEDNTLNKKRNSPYENL